MACQTQPLRRELTFSLVVITGIGMIIGAGIFAVLGSTAASAGNMVWLSFIIAGIAATLTALSYAEFSSMYPRAGAEWSGGCSRVVMEIEGGLSAIGAYRPTTSVCRVRGNHEIQDVPIRICKMRDYGDREDGIADEICEN
jgi:hypothetical protein